MRSRKLWLLLLPVGLLLLVVVMLAAFSFRYSSRVHPGVQVLGVELDGMTLDTATSVIDARASEIFSRRIAFGYNGRLSQFPAAQLGLSIDARATAQEAYAVGRTSGLFGQWTERLGGLWSERKVGPQVRVIREQSYPTLQTLAPGIDLPVKDATLVLGPDGPVMQPSQVGLTLDVAATSEKLPASLDALATQGQPIPLVVRATQPAVTEAQLEETHQLVSAAWSRPLELQFQRRKWTLPVEKVRSMIHLNGAGAEVTPSIDSAGLRTWVSYVASKIDRTPSDAQRKVEFAKVSLVHGLEGYVTDVEASVRELGATMYTGAGTVRPVVAVTAPNVTDAELLPAVQAADAMINRPLRLEHGPRSWELSRKDLLGLLRWSGTGEHQRAHIDSRGLRAWVEGIAAQVNRNPRRALIQDSKDGIHVVPDITGTRVLINKTLDQLQAAITDPAGKVPLQVTRIPATVTAAELQGAVSEANQLTGQPVTLRLNGRSWTADSEVLHSWLRWRGKGAAKTPYLSAQELEKFVDEVANDAYVRPTSAYLSTTDDKLRLVPEVYGLKVDKEATTSQFGALAKSSVREAQPVTSSVKPDVLRGDLKPAYDQAQEWTSKSLSLEFEGATWSLESEDIIQALTWEGEGASTRPEIEDSEMASQVDAEIAAGPAPPVQVRFDSSAVTDEIETALDSGKTTVDITDSYLPMWDFTDDGHKGYTSVWEGDCPDRWIDINLSSQTLAAYEGCYQVRLVYVTPGMAELPTPTGVFEVMRKLSPFKFTSQWPKGHRFYYSDGIGNFALEFKKGGFFIHDSPWRYEYGPGTVGSLRGSHGCVNTPYKTMRFLFYWADSGTPVNIHY